MGRKSECQEAAVAACAGDRAAPHPSPPCPLPRQAILRVIRAAVTILEQHGKIKCKGAEARWTKSDGDNEER